VASLSQGRTAAAQCGLFTHKSVPVIFEPPCTTRVNINKLYVLPRECIYVVCLFLRTNNDYILVQQEVSDFITETEVFTARYELLLNAIPFNVRL